MPPVMVQAAMVREQVVAVVHEDLAVERHAQRGLR
jgi:hypothetical protein